MNLDPSRNYNLALIGLVSLNLTPLIVDHSLFIFTISILSIGWRLLYEYQKTRLPIRPIKMALVTASFYLTYRVHGTLLGVEPATSLLICAVSLKLIDKVSYRDAMIALFLNFILLMAKILVTQSLSMTLLAVFNLIVITSMLFQLHKGKDLNFNIWNILKHGLKITMRISPLLILLFFVFPRFSVGFLGLNAGQSANTGFSGELNPGDISQLVKSDELAFRVTFKSRPPSYKEFYWRGDILSISDGMKWRHFETKAKRNLEEAISQSAIHYELSLEPHYGKWLFSLDYPRAIHFSDKRKQYGLRKHKGGVYKTNNEVGQRIIYEAYSSSQANDQLQESENSIYLSGVNNVSDKLKEFVTKTVSGAETTDEKARKLLSYFSLNYQYSLTPEPMRTNSIDEFIFEHKKGFCEHFAASFAHMMRVIGVPSRVVVGFHGGQPNPLIHRYYNIKKADAHAWVELWVSEESRWVRYDPTSWVEPMRLSLGGQIYNSLPEDVLRQGLDEEGLLKVYASSWIRKYFGQVQFYSDLAALRWNEFLLKYDEQGQQELFQQLGLKFLDRKWLGLLSAFLLLGFFFYFRYFRSSATKKKSPEQKIFESLELKLAKKGYVRGKSEGPRDYLRRCHDETEIKELETFSQIYLSRRYGRGKVSGEKSSSDDLKEALKEIGQQL